MNKPELINFCEFDPYAVKSYCAIHNVDESLNLGDILEVDETKLNDFNWVVGGSPCQSFSIAGKQEGAKWICKDCKHEYNPLKVHYTKRKCCPNCQSQNIDKKTTSSLIVEYLRIIYGSKPNVIIFENVKNLVGKKFKETFDLFYNELNEYGYSCYWKVLNAKNYGVPQNRERIYLVGIKKELDNGKFEFPKGFKLNKLVGDIKESGDLSYAYLTEKQKRFILDINDTQKNTKWEGRTDNGLLNPTISKTLQTKGKARQRVHMNTFFVEGLPDNITAREYKNKYINSNPNIRYATSLERFRLMGFDDKDYYVLKYLGISENQMNILTGNSIVVDVLYYVYLELYKAMPYLFEDIKIGSFFSGVGAFEKALYRLYKNTSQDSVKE